MRHDGRQNGGHNGNRRPEEILAEIERTRSDMDGTLTAIERRLTPGQLVDQGLDYLRNSGANQFVSNLGESVKHNPLPVALVGVGLAWLMATGRHSESDSSQSAGAIRERASQAMQHASESIGSARERLGEGMRSTRERASHLGEAAREQLDRARGGVDYMIREQPLALGALGIAIGALLGAVAPRTRQEDEMMGEARDRLMEKARQTGEEQLDKAAQIAGAAKQAASEEVSRQGMPTGQAEAAGRFRSDEEQRSGAPWPEPAPPVGDPRQIAR